MLAEVLSDPMVFAWSVACEFEEIDWDGGVNNGK
jgi:hypothetical protein